MSDFPTDEEIEREIESQEQSYIDSFDPSVVYRRDYIKNELLIDVTLNDSVRLKSLKDSLVEIIKIASKDGTCKVDYVNNYLNRYKTLADTAKDIGVTISEPIQSPEDIKIEIASIYKANGADDFCIRNAINDMLKGNSIPEMLRLPNAKSVSEKVDKYNNDNMPSDLSSWL